MSLNKTIFDALVNQLLGMVLVFPVSLMDKDGKIVKESRAFEVGKMVKDRTAGTTDKTVMDNKERPKDKAVNDEKIVKDGTTVKDGKTVKDVKIVKDGTTVKDGTIVNDGTTVNDGKIVKDVRVIKVNKRVQKTEEPKKDLITNNSNVSLLVKEDDGNTDLNVLQAIRNTQQHLMTLVEHTVQLEAKFKQTAQSSSSKKEEPALNLPNSVANSEKPAVAQITQNCNLVKNDPMSYSPKLVPYTENATPTKTTQNPTSTKENHVLNLPSAVPSPKNPTQIAPSCSSPKEDPVSCSPNSVPNPENHMSILEKPFPDMNDYKVTIITKRSNEILIKFYRNLQKHKPNVCFRKERHKTKMASKFPTIQKMNENRVRRTQMAREKSISLNHGMRIKYFSTENLYGISLTTSQFKTGSSGVGSYPSFKLGPTHVKLESPESFTKLNSGIPSTYYFSPFVKKQSVNSVSLPDKKQPRFPEEEWRKQKNRKLRPSLINADDIEIE
ncbi:uncharacterized protein LOC119685225 [Teleopsis dalmanni]|uniref:uncharacterized protein LOC119685225 n=1 Tax=Teleopsis dalmanni TaxID=139649 RepID=UPI0018CE91A9|nr:uncharacterized protein LOC119685225 [Teleopsis dalmanni]